MKKAIVAFKPNNVKATKIIIHIPFILIHSSKFIQNEI